MDRYREVAGHNRRAGIYPPEPNSPLKPFDPPATWQDYLIDIAGFAVLAILMVVVVIGAFLI